MNWASESPQSQQAWRDKGQRCSDLIKQHLLNDKETAIHSWVAVRLSDGGSDGSLYITKPVAVEFQLHPQQCAYLKIRLGGISPREATSFLYHTAQMYENANRRDQLIYTDSEIIHGR